MALFDERIPAYQRPCSHTLRVLHIAEQTIFSQISSDTTPAQFAVAKESLRVLCQQQAAEAHADKFHAQSSIFGLHTCVQDVAPDLAFRLDNIFLMKPEPKPAPAPPQPLRTLRDVVEALGDTLQPQPDDLPIGLDDELPDSEGLP